MGVPPHLQRRLVPVGRPPTRAAWA